MQINKRSVQIMLLILAVLAGAGIWWTLSGSSNDPDAFNWNMDVRQGYQQAAERLQAKVPWEYEALKAAEAALKAAQATIPVEKLKSRSYHVGRVYVLPSSSDRSSNRVEVSESTWRAYDTALAALKKAKAAAALKAPQAYKAYEAYYAALVALEKSRLVFGAAQEFDSAVKTATKTFEEVTAAKAVYQAAIAAYELLAALEGPLAESMANKDELKASYEMLRAAYFTLDAAYEAYGVAWNEADEAARKSGDIYTSNAYKAYKAAKASYQAAITAYLVSLPRKARQYDTAPWRKDYRKREAYLESLGIE